MFLVFDRGSDPETHSGIELYCPVPIQHESSCFGVLTWRSTSNTVNHQTHLVRHYLPTYLPQHNFDSRFTQGWPTVVLPLQAHVQPKSASCLDFYFFLFFPWFWWPNFHFYLRFPLLLLFPNQSCVVAITDLTMLDCRSLGCQRGNWEIKLMSMINFTHPVLTCLHKYCNTDKSLQLIHRLLF